MTKTGVQEWAEHSINISVGCEHNCRYCYARFDAVCRFGSVRAGAWPLMRINNPRVDKHYGKFDGKVMFPTTHDITDTNINEYCCVLRKLLDAGNDVLIVSKPHLSCISLICHAFAEHKSHIEFRFTIGSTVPDILAFWEPDAPTFAERLHCLQYAYRWGYKTSVSCEPYLDAFVQYTLETVSGWITESFWIGKLRHFNSRVNLDRVSDEQKRIYINPLKAAQDDKVAGYIYQQLCDHPLARWKDSMEHLIPKGGEL